MKYFGPVFDRSLARKLENKFGAFDSPSMGDLGVTSVEYQGRRGRIISKDEDDKWRYVGIRVMDENVYTNEASYQMVRTRLLGGPYKKFSSLGAYAWATATDYGLLNTASGGSCLSVPIGAGELVFWTTALAAGSTVYRWHMFNGSPKTSSGVKKGKAVKFLTLAQNEHAFVDDPGLPFFLFTGWLFDGETHQRGGAVFYRQFNGGSPDIERIKCVHTTTLFTGWATTELPTPAGWHAMVPRMVCSKARHLAGVVASYEPIGDDWTLQLCTSADNGDTWAMTTITQAVQINDWWYQEFTCAAASGDYDVFAKPNGDVIRHQAGAATAYTYLSGALPSVKVRAIYHLGAGCFLCFSGLDNTTTINLALHRSTDNGATWGAIAGTGLSGLQPEYVGIPMVVKPYVNSGEPGQVVVPIYDVLAGRYKLLSSSDGGTTWGQVATLPSALAPVPSYDAPSFGYEFHQLVDVGPNEKWYSADGSIDMSIGTDPSRFVSLIEV